MNIEELIKDLDPVTIIEFKNYLTENLSKLCSMKNSNSKIVKVNIKMHKKLKIKMYKIFNQFCISSVTSESIFNLSFNR